jgi:radical SAM protein (TIGR01212 family)
MSCPNRDGSIGHRGCIFCSDAGSGDFAGNPAKSITQQIEDGRKRLEGKYHGNSYIAYFQAYTNTYAPIPYLREIYMQAVNHPDVVCISIATRPDCINEEVIGLISEINKIKPVWVELGLQTIHKETIEYIRRGYDNSVYDYAVKQLEKAGIETIVHMIIGLPGENKKMMLQTAQYIARSGVKGIKLQLLYVLEHTDMALDYEKGFFETLTLDEYIDILADIIEILPADMVIHRITGDAPRKILISAKYALTILYSLLAASTLLLQLTIFSHCSSTYRFLSSAVSFEKSTFSRLISVSSAS